MPDAVGQIIFAFFALLLFYGACAVVQMTVIKPKTRYVVIGSFGVFAAMIALIGLLGIMTPNVLPNLRSAVLLLVVAAVTWLPMSKGVRQLLARLTPIDPDSTVDISGVIAGFWLLVLGGAFLLTIDLNSMPEQAKITLTDSIASVIGYPFLAVSLIGFGVTRKWPEILPRLGLVRPTWRQVAIALALVIPLLAAGYGLDALGRVLQPERYAQLEAILKAMSSGITNPLLAVVIGFSAGIGEEILFRGAIQPRLGIVFTALLFAVAHSQYGFSFATIAIFCIGLLLGVQRQRYNTTSAIITHGTYNTIVFLLSYFTNLGTGQ